MEIIKIERGRLTVLHEFSRALGEIHVPTLVRRLVEEFKFTRFPSDFANHQQNSLIFEHGIFGESAFDMTIYIDGIMITSQSDTDIVMNIYNNIAKWAQDEFSFAMHQVHSVATMYESVLTFKSEKDILSPLAAYRNTADHISKVLKRTSNLETEFEAFGITLSADDRRLRGLKPAQFRLERRAGFEFGVSLYFSTAPVKTKDHVRILEEIEQSL